MKKRTMVCLLLTGCVFKVPGVDMPPPDLSLADLIPPPDRVAHLDDKFLTSGACDLVISAGSMGDGGIGDAGMGMDAGTPFPSGMIDTATLTNNPPLPTGCAFTIAMETGSNGQPFEVVVLTVRNLTVEAGATLKILGHDVGPVTQSRPLAIVAADTIRIAGTLDASADHEISGPGGLSFQSTGKQQNGVGRVGVSSGDTDSGGGGGGYRSLGAASSVASGNGAAAAANGGMGYNDNTLSMSVEAGSAGGFGTTFDTTTLCGLRGAGGGSLQLTAANQIAIAGRVLANGGGGRGGCPGSTSDTNGESGGGGGSGGGLYLEAPMVTLGGSLTASGGAGGSGGQDGTTPGMDGENGPAGTAPAAGGPSAGGNSGTGGDGAAGDPVIAATTGTSKKNTGGGGGGVGRIVIRSTTLNRTGAVISPRAVEVPY